MAVNASNKSNGEVSLNPKPRRAPFLVTGSSAPPTTIRLAFVSHRRVVLLSKHVQIGMETKPRTP